MQTLCNACGLYYSTRKVLPEMRKDLYKASGPAAAPAASAESTAEATTTAAAE